MGVRIGLDMGGSTWKLVAQDAASRAAVDVRSGDGLMQVPAGAADVARVFRTFLARLGARPADVDEVALVGVGADAVDQTVLGVPVRRVEEFSAVGVGGRALAGCERCVVMSMGTGTSLVVADARGCRHLGGSGVGGRALQGLAHALLGVDDARELAAIARTGDRTSVDLLVRDLTTQGVAGLTGDLTAANFGKLVGGGAAPDPADLASALVNAVFETLGMMAVFACKGTDLHDVVLVGTLARLPQAREVMDGLGELHGLRMHVPELAPYATAVGALAAGR